MQMYLIYAAQTASYGQIPKAPQSTRHGDTANFDMPIQQTANRMPQNDFNPAYNTTMPETMPGGGENLDEIADDDVSYDPKRGVSLHFDFLSNLERKHRDVRFIYGVYNYTKEIVKNKEAGIMQSEPDPANMARNRINFDKKHILKGKHFLSNI